MLTKQQNKTKKHLNNDIYKLINKNLVDKLYLSEKKANKFVLTYKRKKNIKYNEGLGNEGWVFNADDNLLKYSTVEFEDGIIKLDTILTFARKLDRVESDFNPNIWAADIKQAIDTEVAYKRNKILEIINKETVANIQGKKSGWYKCFTNPRWNYG